MTWASEMSDLADAVVGEFAAPSTVTITASAAGAMNTTTGLRASTPQTATVTPIRFERRHELDGQSKSSYEEAMIAVKVADVSFTVDTRCKVTIGSVTFSVVKVSTVLDAKLYELQLQRAISAK